MMEDVIVTATKQAQGELLQEVPLTVDAFSAHQLESFRMTNLEDLATKLPGVSMDSGTAYVGQAYFSIRGVST
jgi:outer membrane receptor for ferrienterochelin and colicin